MKVSTSNHVVILKPDEATDPVVLQALTARDGHVFELHIDPGSGVARFFDLGPRPMACREPINIVWTDPKLDPQWRPISNLAPAQFELDGQVYASIEGFWQGLKFPSKEERARIAALSGTEAMEAGRAAPQSDTVMYRGWPIPVGRPEHWGLMRRACKAKFTQDAVARNALLSTGERLLIHKTRRDSRTIPGAIMVDIWMDIRRTLASPQKAARLANAANNDPDVPGDDVGSTD